MSSEIINLSQNDIPRNWYNILPDLPESLPPYRDAENGKEIRDLPDIYTKTASNLEFSGKRWVNIPNAIRSAYIHCGRPRPLIRAKRLEKFLKTPARIYFKCENLSPGGSFKINASLPQAYWAMKEGYKQTVFTGGPTPTGFIHIFSSKFFGLAPAIFMTRADCEENKEQVLFIKKMLEAKLLQSPSIQTEIGREILKENPNHKGSWVIKKKEVAEEVRKNKDAVIIINSFLNHILMTQTIIGLEVKKQLQLIDEKPNIFIAAVGGGSNFYGLIAPFIRDYLNKKLHDVKFLAVESETTSKLTNGSYNYVSMQGIMPGLLVKSYKVKNKTHLPLIIARGIQTENTAPLLSFLRHSGFIDTVVYPKDEKAIFEAARIFLNTEGYLLAPESSYSIRAAIDEAYKAKHSGEKKVVVVSLSATTYLNIEEKSRYLSFMI